MSIQQLDQLQLNQEIDTDQFLKALIGTENLAVISIISKLPLPIAILDCHSRVVGLNQLFADMYEADVMSLHQKLLSDFSTIIYSQFVDVMQVFEYETEKDQLDYEFYFKGKFYLIYYKALRDSEKKIKAIVVISTDVTKLKRREKVLLLNNKKLHDHFYVDLITDLPNQAAFEQFIKTLSPDDYANFTFLKIDLNNFKKFNTLNSYTRGDEVLVQMGNMLNEVAPHDYSKVFRLNAASFIVSLQNATEWAALTLAERLKLTIQQMNIVFDHRHQEQLTASIGIFHIPQEMDLNEHSILQQLDLAFREAKSESKNSIFMIK